MQYQAIPTKMVGRIVLPFIKAVFTQNLCDRKITIIRLT